MTNTVTKKGVFKHANIYGNIDVRKGLPEGYCHVPQTPGIKLSHWLEKLKINYIRAMTGFKISSRGYIPVFDGVVIASRSRNKLITVIEQKLKEKSAEKKEKERQKQEQEEKRTTEDIDKLANQYPRLDRKFICQLVANRRRIISIDAIGYQFGHGTKSYWNDLGFRVSGKPAGCLVRGKQIYPIYGNGSLVPKRSKMTVTQLKKMWLKKYKSEELLLANALKIANRLQKVNHINDYYDIKDKWIRANQSDLIDGKLVRHERKECWSCNGEGNNGYEECFDCCGTGFYSDRTLYEHNFNIDGHAFCFHSYLKPDKLNEEKGANLKNYGRPFKKSELPLPPQVLIMELIKKMMV